MILARRRHCNVVEMPYRGITRGLGQTAAVRLLSGPKHMPGQTVNIELQGPPGWTVARRRHINGLSTGESKVSGAKGFWSDGQIGADGFWRRNFPADAGFYSVVVSNPCGQVESAEAELTVGPCQADLNGDCTLDVFDFLEFVNLFNAGDPAADCDGDGLIGLFDFLCFSNGFSAGCWTSSARSRGHVPEEGSRRGAENAEKSRSMNSGQRPRTTISTSRPLSAAQSSDAAVCSAALSFSATPAPLREPQRPRVGEPDLSCKAFNSKW